MKRAWLGLSLPLAACVTVGGGDGTGTGPSGSITVSVVLPAAILVGEAVQAKAQTTDNNGQTQDAMAAWRSSNPAVATVNAQGQVTGVVAGQATIYADVGTRTGSASLSVTDDTRFGYALAEQPNAPGPWIPNPANTFNSSGGVIEITRPSTGVYSVRFAGLGRANGQRDDVQLSAYGAPAGVYCKLADNWLTVGADMVIEVRCFAGDGTPADNRFTILLSGAHAYAPASEVGFAIRPPMFQMGSVDTSAAAFNSGGGGVFLSRNGVGNYSLAWPQLTTSGGPVAVQVTALGGNTARCHVGAVDPPNAGLAVRCATPDGADSDARFSVLWIGRGRPGRRVGYAWANQPVAAVDYAPNPAYSFNSSGGPIFSRQLATGQYRVVFSGLARPAGATETVLAAPFSGPDRTCSITAWATTAVNDLTVTLSCYDPAGAPASTSFAVLVIQ